MLKFFESEGMKSAGEATPAEVRNGYYDANHTEPDLTFDQYIKREREMDNFGGVVGFQSHFHGALTCGAHQQPIENGECGAIAQ